MKNPVTVIACVLVVLIAHLGASGCATTSTSADDLKPLRQAVEAYNEAYRWKNFERAASFLPEEMRLPFIAAYEEDEKSLHIEDYQILQVRLLNEKAADVEVRVTYMMLPSVVVQDRRLVQHWHKVAEHWTLETEDNSIRDLRPDARPENVDAFGGFDPPPGEDGATEVKVTDPQGNVIRDDTGATTGEPATDAPD